ncbi:MAG TPA: FAD-binding oxidoreductase [Thermoplasmata archaeon]|nr:FAD-binding oxidoreductase [Thermoplasmata archaeon]
MSERPADVLILGAGIAGCALAYHLAHAHVGPIVVYDPRTPGAGATGRAAGIVTEQLWNRWDVDVTRQSKEQYARLSAKWDPSAYTVNGFVRWASGPEAKNVVYSALSRLQAWGVDVRELGRPELAQQVPWGRFDDDPRAIWSPNDAVVTPSTMGEIYAEGARRAGVEFVLGTPMESFRSTMTGWELNVRGRAIRGWKAVVAAGAWSKQILKEAGHPMPLSPYRTQAAVLRPPSGPDVFASVHDIDEDVYARPESNGRILAGNGTRLVEVDPETYRTGHDEEFLTHLAQTFERRLPGWADAELVRAWAGVCSSTPDRRPLVGPVPRADGLFVIAGFNGFGVMRAGGVALRLAQLISAGGDRDREVERLEPVLPARFEGAPTDFAPRPGFTLDPGDDPRF